MPQPSKATKAKGKVDSKAIEAALAGEPDTTDSEGNEPGPEPEPEPEPKSNGAKGKTIGGFTIESVSGMEQYINLLIYGDPGAGKTVLAGSAAAVEEMSPVLFVDVEGGTMPLRTLYPSVEVVRVTSFRDLQKVYNELYKGQSGYRTIVLDSLTEMQKLSMAGIMKKARQENPDINPDQPRIQDWGVNLGQCRTMIRGFRDLPMNCIFTALNDEGEKNGRTTNRPLFQGKLKGEGPGFVDIVAYYYVKRRGNDSLTRNLLTKATDTTLAKDRSTLLPTQMEDPTMADIYYAILGSTEAA